MDRRLLKRKPAVGKPVLLFLAGGMWMGVGVFLLVQASSWLRAAPEERSLLLSGTGVGIALLVHHFGFLKIVDRNLGRILPVEGSRCVFSFISWKSYIIVALMIALGAILRHSPLPKPYLSVVYIGIGLALVLSSIRYLRVLVGQLRSKGRD